jgi:SAM-dependent methyltransferase
LIYQFVGARPVQFNMGINYDHATSLHIHTLHGAKAALSKLFPQAIPKSVLDVGCGTGTWLRAAKDLGSLDVFGVDGVSIPPAQLLVDPQFFRTADLSLPLNLGRCFDVVFCLEVAEHLDATAGKTLINSLTKHAEIVYFSAACPGQGGTHHVNCQWPAYWQALFNEAGFTCDDLPKWTIWDENYIEAWYRQNIFLARRSSYAGKEPRIKSVIHPEMLRLLEVESEKTKIENGFMNVSYYLLMPLIAFGRKVRRKLLN